MDSARKGGVDSAQRGGKFGVDKTRYRQAYPQPLPLGSNALSEVNGLFAPLAFHLLSFRGAASARRMPLDGAMSPYKLRSLDIGS